MSASMPDEGGNQTQSDAIHLSSHESNERVHAWGEVEKGWGGEGGDHG